MSKTIVGVPESVSRAAWIAMFKQYGFDPGNVKSLQFHHSSIEAVVFEVDEAGTKLLGEDGYIKHIVSIPVVDEESSDV